jgi:hypothetical protein
MPARRALYHLSHSHGLTTTLSRGSLAGSLVFSIVWLPLYLTDEDKQRNLKMRVLFCFSFIVMLGGSTLQHLQKFL